MNVYAQTRKSHCWNEDRFITGKNFFVVLDGATPLKRNNSFNEARWLVSYIKKNFSRYKGSVKYRLSRLCEDACRDLPADEKGEDCLPSASACWVEFKDGKVSAGVLGDCEVTAVYVDGRILRLYDGRLNVLDGIALAEMVSAAEERGIHVNEARNFINGTLIKHRKLANKPEGYNALVPFPKSEINEKSFEIGTEGLKSIYLYSDGFSQAFENLKIYSTHEEMFGQIENVDEEIKKITEVSFGDVKCDKYPRFKKIDDITVIRIDL